MKHIITYTPRQKEMLLYAINLALAWHEGDTEYLCEVLFKALKRHRPDRTDIDVVHPIIRKDVNEIREIDVNGEVFGKTEIIKVITISDSGETVLSQEEVEELQRLTHLVFRLLVGQLDFCFDWYYLPSIDDHAQARLEKLTAHLHCLCWNQERYDRYGIRYSEESDILWDIYHVLRYQCYLNFDSERKESLRPSNMSDRPRQYAKEPLLMIKTKKRFVFAP